MTRNTGKAVVSSIPTSAAVTTKPHSHSQVCVGELRHGGDSRVSLVRLHARGVMIQQRAITATSGFGR